MAAWRFVGITCLVIPGSMGLRGGFNIHELKSQDVASLSETNMSRQYTLGVYSLPYNSISDFWTADVGSDALPCPFRCKFIGKASDEDLKKADAVMVDSTDGNLPPWQKPANQIWIGKHWEAPSILHPGPLQEPYMQHFDYTSSYRADADIPYFSMITDTTGNFSTKLIREQTVPFLEKSSNAMMSVWLSNCNFDGTGRMSIISHLQSFGISVASYGACNHNADLDPNLVGLDRGHQLISMSRKHLFLFAAENSDCPYYHTEKIYHAFMASVVPVYLGDSKTLDEYVPRHSVIKANDFESVQALADYLKKVASDERLYNSYLEWESEPLPAGLSSKIQHPDQSQCEVCTFLHTTTHPRGAHAEQCTQAKLSFLQMKSSMRRSVS